VAVSSKVETRSTPNQKKVKSVAWKRIGTKKKGNKRNLTFLEVVGRKTIGME